MNDLTTSGQGGALTTNEAFDPYAEYGRQNTNNIVGKLLRFSKGDYLVGDDEIEAKTQMVANMANLLIGWIRWEDQKPAETVMGLLGEGYKPQKRNELGFDDESDWPVDKDGKPQDPWQETNYLVFMDPSDNELYTFTTSSAGGRNAISKLCKDYGTKRRMNPGKFPIVSLEVDSYKHKDTSLGRIKVPELKIVGWVAESSFHGIEATSAPSDDVSTETKRIQNMANEKTSSEATTTKPRANF